MEILLTIVIPYYDTFDITNKLLNQFITQANSKVEIILIDDYCKKEFANKKEELKKYNIKLIEHKQNMGVAKTRNEGIDLAKGKYVGFCDADDQVTFDYVERLLEAIDRCDTSIINFDWLDLTYNIIYKRPKNYAPWKAIYKKETMPRFREDRQYGEEDIDFQEEINRKVENYEYSITYLNRVLYLYNSEREGSLFWKKTHKRSEEQNED